MPILIRDDDTNFFTRIHMLKSVYSRAWSEGFKVSLSVVPFQKGTDGMLVPPEMRNTESCYSVSDNKELIKFLKMKIQEKSVEIFQHGFSHINTFGGRGEFGGNSVQKRYLEYGKNILTEAFGMQPTFFVPPYDDISERNLKLILEQRMIPFYRDTNFDKILRSGYVPDFVKQTVFKLVMNRSKKRYLRTTNSSFGLRALTPVSIRIEKNRITWSLPEVQFAKLTSFDSLLDLASNTLRYCSRSRMPVCILNHYHYYFYDWESSVSRTELFRTWNKVLEYFNKVNFGWKTTLSEVCNRIEKIRKTKVAKTGSKITIEFQDSLQDFSFRINGRLESNPDVMIDEQTNIFTIKNSSPRSKIILYER